MIPDKIAEAADALVAARKGQPIPALPEPAQPQSREDGFAIQDAHLKRLADNFSNGGLVYGGPAPGWEGLDLVHPPIEVTADGNPFADCTGLRAGNPIDLLVTAVNLATQRGGIAAGTFVTTGTHTGM